jgi:carbamate kinase
LSKRLLIALGGNAIKQANEMGTTQEQFHNVAVTCEQIATLFRRKAADSIAITHGNGPQAGNLLVQQEQAQTLVPPQTLDVVGAMTQGQIGYMFQQTLQNVLRDAGGSLARLQVISVVNQVLVSPDDPDFLDPTKPVGNFFSKEEADKLVEEKGYVINPKPGKEHMQEKMKGFVIKQVKPLGSAAKVYRRVVPSPDPIANVEGDTVRKLVDQGVIVVASGGGGIPVFRNKDGHLEGVFAVIDKDKAGERMAEAINATDFLVLTDIDQAMLNFGKPDQKPIDKMTVTEAEAYLAQGQFLSGSMAPKVEACLRFLKWGGERAIISSLSKAVDALGGKSGTQITK